MVSRVSSDLFARVTTRRTVENVIDQIVDRLKAGLLSEGDFLPSERTLAEVMEVSRRTIREATRILAEAGVLEVLPGSSGGMKVRSMWVPEELSYVASDEPQASKIFDVLEARRTLEPRVAQLAAVRGGDEHFSSMRRSIELQWKHRDDRRKVSQMNVLFHRSMWQAAGNETLESAMKLIFRQLEVAFDMTLRTSHDTERSIEIHERTLYAVMNGDTEDIATAMDEHMVYLEAICESVVGRRRWLVTPDFLRPRASALSGTAGG